MAEAESLDEKLSDTAALVHRNFRDGRDHSSVWRQETDTWYAMVAGEQWDQEDLMRLQEQQRPAVVFNRILRTINAITGTQVANRQETRFIPREIGDVQVNEVLTAAADWVRDNCDAEDEESDAFEDMCISGMGWTETRMDYESNPEGDVVIERVEPTEMYWDPGARKKNLSDAQWVMHVKLMPLAEFQARWPDADEDLVTSPWEGSEDDISQRTHVYPQDAYKVQQGAKGPKAKRMVRVAHMQWAVREDAYRVGKKAERVDGKTFEKLRDRLDKSNIKYVRQQQVTWKRAFVAGGVVLEEGDCPYPDGPTFRCMTFKRDKKSGTWFGMVKAMVDPQRFGNKFFSLILEILNKGSKGGIMVEASATEDFRDLESKWARTDGVIKLKEGAISRKMVMPKPAVEMPAGLDRLMGFSLDAVHEVTGINLELLGFANREQPGVLEHQRKQAGLTIIAPLFDAMRRYRKEQGRVLLYFIQQYLSDGRLIRIMAEGQEQYVPLMKQEGVAEYDVIVDEAPTSPNMKERVFSVMVEMLPAMAKMGITPPLELLDYSPLPSALIQKWKEHIEKGTQLPPEVQQEIQRLTEENKKLKDKKEETFANLQLTQAKTQADAQLKREEAVADIEIEKQKLELERQKAQMELELEVWKTQEEMKILKWKATQETAHKQQQVATDLALKSAQAAGEGGKSLSAEQLRKLFRGEEAQKRTVKISRGPDGFIEAADLEEMFEGEEPRRKRIVVHRGPDGFIESADIEAVEAQGNA